MLTAKAANVKERGYPGIVRVVQPGIDVDVANEESVSDAITSGLARDAFMRVAAANARGVHEGDGHTSFEFADFGVARLFYDLAIELKLIVILERRPAVVPLGQVVA